jgi:hypothetical protein
MEMYLKKSQKLFLQKKKLKEVEEKEKKKELLDRINKKKQYSKRFKSLGPRKQNKKMHTVGWGANQPLIKEYTLKSNVKEFNNS